MQVGIDSFAAAFDDPSLSIDASERLQNLIEEIKLADQIGLDVFGIGEHHRRDVAGSAGQGARLHAQRRAIHLAAIAECVVGRRVPRYPGAD